MNRMARLICDETYITDIAAHGFWSHTTMWRVNQAEAVFTLTAPVLEEINRLSREGAQDDEGNAIRVKSFDGIRSKQDEVSEIKINNSFTTKYLNGEMKIEIPSKRRKGNGKKISLL